MATAIRNRDHIVLYGDYDVDGITGVAILWHMLKLSGASVSYYVPHRTEEGYGLNEQAARRLVDEGAKLIVTVDCGIGATEIAAMLQELGTRLIITDHHLPPSKLPPADVIVHPSALGSSPNTDLCGAGVAFKVAWALAREIGQSTRVPPSYRELLVELIPLAALGTIADVVPLCGENRLIARHGLDGLPRTKLPGLRALMEIAGLSGSAVNGYDVGFKIAPRLNAAGRMGHARLAVELLTGANADRGREISLYLDEHNKARRATERKITRAAIETIERQNLAGDARRAIVLAGEGWHAGVIGIVAARLVDRFRRPSIVITRDHETSQGSGRSISSFNLCDALGSCRQHLITHGGHAMAAGLRIKTENIDAFTEAFVAVANNRLTGADLLDKIRIDCQISLDELTLPAAEAVAALGPFGAGNPRPKLVTDWVELTGEPRCVGNAQDHLQATFLHGGASVRAIGFGLGSHIDELKAHRRCRIVFEPFINEYQGRRTVEMQMIDMKFPDLR